MMIDKTGSNWKDKSTLCRSSRTYPVLRVAHQFLNNNDNGIGDADCFSCSEF